MTQVRIPNAISPLRRMVYEPLLLNVQKDIGVKFLSGGKKHHFTGFTPGTGGIFFALIHNTKNSEELG